MMERRHFSLLSHWAHPPEHKGESRGVPERAGVGQDPRGASITDFASRNNKKPLGVRQSFRQKNVERERGDLENPARNAEVASEENKLTEQREPSRVQQQQYGSRETPDDDAKISSPATHGRGR